MSATQEISVHADARRVAAEPADPRADDALTAAERASAAAEATAEPKRRGNDPESEVRALVDAIVEARNPALRAAIQKTADAKIAEVTLAKADAGDEAAFKAWQTSRNVLDEAANDLAHAPISGAFDALLRSQCFIDAVGRDPETDLTVDDAGDAITLTASLLDGLCDLAHQEPDPEAWEGLVAETRAAVRLVANLDRALESMDQPSAVCDGGLREDSEVRRDEASLARDELIDRVLHTEPPHVGGVLFQMELLAGRYLDEPLDLTTYASRSAAVEREGTGTVSEGLALIATHLAALRDRSIPEDWAEQLEAHEDVPGFDQAARYAIDAGLAADDIQMIHQGERSPVAPRQPQMLPILQFAGPEGGYLHARPDGLWKWEPVK